MSGPDFEEVLAAHVIDIGKTRRDPEAGPGYWMSCACGFEWTPVEPFGQHDAHLSAALHAELARWLGDEGTREVVAESIHTQQEYTTCWDPADVGLLSRKETPMRDLGDHGRDFYRTLATAALAALTTTEADQ